MNFHGKHFRVEVLLEAPLWLMAVVAVLMTIAVVASAILTA